MARKQVSKQKSRQTKKGEEQTSKMYATESFQRTKTSKQQYNEEVDNEERKNEKHKYII